MPIKKNHIVINPFLPLEHKLISQLGLDWAADGFLLNKCEFIPHCAYFDLHYYAHVNMNNLSIPILCK